MSEHTDYDQTKLDQLHADLTHLAGAFHKRGYHEQAASMQWCADELAKVKEARNAS